MKKWILSLLVPIFLIVGFSRVYAETRPENGIYDPQHHLTQETEDKLVNFNTQHEAQLGIYIVDTLNGKNLENFARETAREWKIGYSDSNKGALIMIAVKDRKFRIETSNNMATELTDSESRAILENVKPFMHEEDYDTAVSIMIDSIKKELNSQEQSPKADPSREFLSYFTTIKFKNDMIGIGILIAMLMSLLMLMSVALKQLQHNRYMNLSERSQYEYDGYDKLYPNDPGFVQNSTWTAALTAAFYKSQKQKRRNNRKHDKNRNTRSKKRRSRDENDNYVFGSFSSTAYNNYNSSSSSSSSSSWSSSDWGGGGFDGGGSSSSW